MKLARDGLEYSIIKRDTSIHDNRKGCRHTIICTQYFKFVEFPFLLHYSFIITVDPTELTFVSDITTSRGTTRHLFNTNKEVH